MTYRQIIHNLDKALRALDPHYVLIMDRVLARRKERADMVSLGTIARKSNFARGHLSKVAYPNRDAAQAAIRATKQRYAMNPTERKKDLSTLESYECEFGGEGRHFHIGHRRKKR